MSKRVTQYLLFRYVEELLQAAPDPTIAAQHWWLEISDDISRTELLTHQAPMPVSFRKESFQYFVHALNDLYDFESSLYHQWTKPPVSRQSAIRSIAGLWIVTPAEASPTVARARHLMRTLYRAELLDLAVERYLQDDREWLTLPSDASIAKWYADRDEYARQLLKLEEIRALRRVVEAFNEEYAP